MKNKEYENEKALAAAHNSELNKYEQEKAYANSYVCEDSDDE